MEIGVHECSRCNAHGALKLYRQQNVRSLTSKGGARKIEAEETTELFDLRREPPKRVTSCKMKKWPENKAGIAAFRDQRGGEREREVESVDPIAGRWSVDGCTYKLLPLLSFHILRTERYMVQEQKIEEEMNFGRHERQGNGERGDEWKKGESSTHSARATRRRNRVRDGTRPACSPRCPVAAPNPVSDLPSTVLGTSHR